MENAMLSLVAVYNVFNIKYPKYLSSVLIFVEEYIIKMSRATKLPATVKKFMDSISPLIESESEPEVYFTLY